MNCYVRAPFALRERGVTLDHHPKCCRDGPPHIGADRQRIGTVLGRGVKQSDCATGAAGHCTETGRRGHRALPVDPLGSNLLAPARRRGSARS